MHKAAVRHVLTQRRYGFTILELFVVITIIGMLVALLVPAVQAARETARRSQCASQTRQIMLAFHNHADMYREFPGVVRENQHWDVRILPFLEQQRPTVDSSGQVTYTPDNVAVYQCPSDPFARPTIAGKSYFPNDGLGAHVHNGFYCTQNALPIRASDVSDGLSMTAALSERLTEPPPPLSTQVSTAEEAFWRHRLIRKTTTFISDMDKFADECELRSTNPSLAFVMSATYNHVQTPNKNSCTNGDRNDSRATDYMAVTAASLHPGGVNVGLGDGSVRFISETIDRGTWRAMGTRNGGEVLPEF